MPSTKQDQSRVGGVQDHDVQISRDGLPAVEGTVGKGDVADPHPSTEEDDDKVRRPGGTKTPKEPDIGPNSYAHDGNPPPRPKNEGAGPQ